MFKLLQEAESIYKLGLLIEKDFFDTNDSDEDQNTKGGTTGGDEGGGDLDFGGEGENQELADVPLSETLQLRVLWAYLLYSYKLSRQLSNINDKFDEIHEHFKELFQLFRDFVINYEDIQPEKRKEFLINFRKEFIATLKEMKQKLASL